VLAILDITKSAWLNVMPAEFTRMKMFVTVSMDKSEPTRLLVIFLSFSITWKVVS
jgi:hypothetical protein